ncbi:single-stranded DNA-binding protein [Companilactobacillus allii]|uniref:Single-stranded DNA-binding protein n=1 Tax=Companilactobacillus allii TaxID=1847728 RepID=A0A1P8Q4E0_9LACO|nr:single-stranded DNA-binding protein [Companilactobacillus allii]APX72697.1 single-stranded DNA-binding protein [Companilactobacillus allii]USQ69803.1 single-stranded DNA-binding protein [Companilactobacillus allii]
MLNKCVLVGRLTKDVELRYTNNNDAAANFIIAVNRNFKNAQGEREADFINCVIWRKAAEIFSKYTHKGSLVAIDGRIQTRTYDNNQGQTVYVTELLVDEFSFLDSNNSDSNQSNNNNSQQRFNRNNSQNSNNYQNNNQSQFGNNSPFENGRQNNNAGNGMNDPYKSNNGGINVSDDQLPF